MAVCRRGSCVITTPPSSLPLWAALRGCLAHKPPEIRRHIPIPPCGHPEPPGELSTTSSLGPPVPRAARPLLATPGGSAPGSGHLVPCRAEGAGPTALSQEGQHHLRSPPRALSGARGGRPRASTPAPCGAWSRWGMEHPGPRGPPTSPVPSTDRSGRGDAQSRREPRAAAGPRGEGRGSPGRVPL